jgi:hypothetical protein
MRFGPFFVVGLLLSVGGFAFAQAPVSVVSYSWQVDRQPGVKPVSNNVHPEKELTGEKYADRKRRENQVQGGARDPGDLTPDARRAELDKISDESRTPRAQDVDGYTYRATVKNDSDKTLRVLYWEYRFADLADPAKVIRREFLCAVNIKPGDKKEVMAFSTLAPSDVISLQELSKSNEKRFDEKVVVNRIEFNDDSVLNRGGWKLDEHKTAIDRVTSTPWGKEVCRSL